jgi:ubiquinone/menaquinone biosynthesis C-methylase UbiE
MPLCETTSGIVDYSRDDFREYWRGAAKAFLHESECRILRGLLPASPGWFLDVGAGFGRLTPVYAGGGRKIVLIDYAVNHLQMALERHGAGVCGAVAADAGHLPFRDGVFRGGLSVRLFHHLKEPERFLREFARVLRPGAPAVVNYMNRRSLLRLIRFGPSGFRRSHEPIPNLLYLTHPAWFRHAAEEAGFTTGPRRGSGFAHQIVHDQPRLTDWMDRAPAFRAAMTGISRAADAVLGRIDLALMEFVRLTRTGRPSGVPEPASFLDLLACPTCRSELVETGSGVRCAGCGRAYLKQGGVYDLRV